jgi:GAF domain-containing protein
MLDAAVDLLGADRGHVELLDADGRLNIVAQRGFSDEFLETIRAVPAEGNSASARAFRCRERVIIEDVEQTPARESAQALAHAGGYSAVVSIPLLGGDAAAQGVLSIHFRNAHRPSDSQLHRLDLYVRQASDFVSRCRIEQTLRDTERALRESDQLKNEFLALLGHELRNPLAPIYTTSEILSRTLSGYPHAQSGIAVIKR